MGETFAQRVELAIDSQDLETQSFPVNFLKHLEGTALGNMGLMERYEALRTIAIFFFKQKTAYEFAT